MAHAPREFWSFVDRSGGPDACWPWLGMRRSGYGCVKRGGRRVQATHIALDLAGTPLKPGEWALHHCDNPPCVNTGPRHLFAGTAGDNARDRSAKGRSVRLLGDQNPSRRHPERLSRGERHSAILRAVVPRGDRHWTARARAS